jgi:hypothetical protein
VKLREHWDELGRVYDESNRRWGDTLMRDRTYDRLRTPPARRTLVAVVAAFVLLKVSVRSLADVPEDCLDERQLALRYRVYHEAYRWIGLVAVLAGGTGVIAFIALGKDPSGDTLAVTWNQLMAFFYVHDRARDRATVDDPRPAGRRTSLSNSRRCRSRHARRTTRAGSRRRRSATDP